MMAEPNLHRTELLSIHPRRQNQSLEKVLRRALTSSSKDRTGQNTFILVYNFKVDPVDLLPHLLSNSEEQTRYRYP